MYQLLETIKCQNGILENIPWHNARFNQARKEYFGLSTKMNLANFVKVPSSARKGLYRCRITYSKSIDNVEYIRHQYKKVESLKLVYNNEIDYHLKFANRDKLNELFESRENCDDILIVKNRYITDSSTANLLFFDGQKWWANNTPLLAGTKREKLISERKIKLREIKRSDLHRYQKVGLINAMWDFSNMPVISTNNIF